MESFSLLLHGTAQLHESMMNSPGLISINEQCWSTHNIAVRDSSSILATDTVELNDSNNGLNISPNWDKSKKEKKEKNFFRLNSNGSKRG